MCPTKTEENRTKKIHALWASYQEKHCSQARSYCGVKMVITAHDRYSGCTTVYSGRELFNSVLFWKKYLINVFIGCEGSQLSQLCHTVPFTLAMACKPPSAVTRGTFHRGVACKPSSAVARRTFHLGEVCKPPSAVTRGTFHLGEACKPPSAVARGV